MVEHRSPKPSVVSSNLTAPANKKAPLAGVFLLAKEGIIRTHEESEFDYKRKRDFKYRGRESDERSERSETK